MQNRIWTEDQSWRKFSAYERRVREWRKQKEQFKSLPDNKRQLGTPGWKALLPDMEEELAAWIEEQKSQHLCVTRTAIQMEAKELHQWFGATRECLEKFLHWHGFNLRRKRAVSQSLPEHYISPKYWHSSWRPGRRYVSILLSWATWMRPPALWLDMPGHTTVARVGEQTVSIRSSGHNRVQFTVVMADGRKLKPYVLLQGFDKSLSSQEYLER